MINIGSIQSVAAPDFRNYEGTSMSTPPDYHFHKHGLIGLTRYLAALAGPHGVRVNAISPGGAETAETPAIFRENYCRRVFLGRMARPRGYQRERSYFLRPLPRHTSPDRTSSSTAVIRVNR